MIGELPAWVIQIAQLAGGAACAYAGIRADLARMHERLESIAKDAERANQRLDHFMLERR